MSEHLIADVGAPFCGGSKRYVYNIVLGDMTEKADLHPLKLSVDIAKEQD